MTENQAIKILKVEKSWESDDRKIDAFIMGIEALTEIQQYRAMEEKLNGISVAQVVGGFINTIEKGTAEEYMRGRILTNRETDMWDEYRAIGTIEEFKTLKEKNEPKKPIDRIAYCNCPSCGEVDILGYPYCPICGQKLDWQ